jgi:hypothetical protein
MDDQRCVVCGKAVEPKKPAFRIARGEINTRNNWKEEAEWGLAHRSCFVSAVDSPNAVMNELRRQAREGANPSAT